MKSLTLISLALALSACGHATTEMDRELALKLADRPQVVAAAPPIINVNVTNGAPQATQAPSDDYWKQAFESGTDTRTNCMNSPVYKINGDFSHYVKNCFGGQ